MPNNDDKAEDAASAAMADATERLADLLYTGVGLGVLAINRLQVARRTAQKKLGDETALPGIAALSDLLADPDKAQAVLARLREELQDIDDRMDGVENRLGSFLESIEPELPDGVRELAGAFRNLADDHASNVRSLLGLRLR